jgi:hypothetical protein
MQNRKTKALAARLCFGHLGGTLGERFFTRLVELGWFRRDGDKTTVYEVTALGIEELEKLGVDVYERR